MEELNNREDGLCFLDDVYINSVVASFEISCMKVNDFVIISNSDDSLDIINDEEDLDTSSGDDVASSPPAKRRREE